MAFGSMGGVMGLLCAAFVVLSGAVAVEGQQGEALPWIEDPAAASGPATTEDGFPPLGDFPPLGSTPAEPGAGGDGRGPAVPGPNVGLSPEQVQLLRSTRLLAQASIAANLTGQRPNVTFFAPDDGAWRTLFTTLNTTQEALFRDRARMRSIVSYFIVPFIIRTAQMRDSQVLPTINSAANITISVAKAGPGADPAISLYNAACPACPVARIILPDVPNLVPDSPVIDLTPIQLISAVLLPSLA